MSLSNIVAFRCPLCFEVFETPIGLLCGHTFCRSCLLSHIPASALDTDDSIVPDAAPTLRGPHEVADSLAGARTDPSNGTCPVCNTPLPPSRQWQQNFAIAAAIEEVGRVLTNVVDAADLLERSAVHESAISTVYRARYQNRIVAVKEYKADVDQREKQRQRTEFNLLRSLRHDNVVLFLGVCERPFSVVTEFAEHGSLRDFLASGVIYTPTTVLRLAAGIAAGVEYLHGQRVMHRSLRCENILVTADYKALICDFRVSSMITLCQSLSSAGEMDRRVLPSLAPERLRGEPYSWQADSWSFGMTLYELVTRLSPYGGVAEPFQIIADIINGVRPPIPEEVPPAFSNIINACWAAEPARRPSFTEIRRAIEAINL